VGFPSDYPILTQTTQTGNPSGIDPTEAHEKRSLHLAQGALLPPSPDGNSLAKNLNHMPASVFSREPPGPVRQSVAGIDYRPNTYLMQPFRLWLEHRPQEVPDAGTLALLIARSGARGTSREEMGRALGVPSESLEPLLRAMVVAGQVVVLKRDDQLVYRTAG